MSDTQTYQGSCHCGKVRFEVTADLSTTQACNCSICSRTGWRLSFVPATQFRLLSGEDAVTDYQFGKKHLHHPFCATCGVRAFSHGNAKDGTKTYAVNARCLDGVDAESLAVKHFDGKRL